MHLPINFSDTWKQLDFFFSCHGETVVLDWTLTLSLMTLPSRMPIWRRGDPPTGQPSGPERLGLPPPLVRGCQGLRPPRPATQALPGPGSYPRYYWYRYYGIQAWFSLEQQLKADNKSIGPQPWQNE